ncbi:MAG: LacI family DNA-binding transcriptional regulator [Rhizobiaceae bacterium]|nr:LacI family DNA-binding transcriptional regulator [Rhizobiaceae bacterium]
MTHRFSIKELALQAGLSTATIDRVINNRAHVSPQTRRRVDAAFKELEDQEAQLSSKGRRLFVDFIIEAPTRFTREVESACNSVITGLSPAVFRPRYHMKPKFEETEILQLLSGIKKRGSQGVIIAAEARDSVRQLIDELGEQNIPVLAFVTDQPNSQRLAYVGIDNHQAGKVAAYLMDKLLFKPDATILTTIRRSNFSGEDERLSGFQSTLTSAKPDIDMIIARGGDGLSSSTSDEVKNALQGITYLDAVYCMGGGNEAIIKTLDEFGLKPNIYIAHDLDEENIDLLRAEKITAVIHHDVAQDLRNAFTQIAAYHKLIPPYQNQLNSDIQIITPLNLPNNLAS